MTRFFGLIQEPFNYAEPVPSIVKFYMELRYSLMQCLYDAMFENLITGLPIARCMVSFSYPLKSSQMQKKVPNPCCSF
jgi:alpha-glucosidase (family GH31 glycosyl hydrolase)